MESKIISAVSDSLPGNHSLLLQKFFKQFLPKSNNKRKYSHNEFSFVYNTVAGIFLHHKKMKISEEEMLFSLNELGYSIYIADYNKTGKNEKDYYRFYIGISSGSVLSLKKVAGKISYYRNPANIVWLNTLKEEISEFFRLEEA